ncbi:META domain-containing protein [Marinobacter vulgaris]|uniref:META domain-containing protein n=1 Tax=Marinobacter vulgaris TaxID=1928331 RepID=UPI002228535F|nr:META domain-containing protein [Marinobacter vulgaris]
MAGAGLDIRELSQIEMACAPALMMQEEQLLGMMANVRRFSLNEKGDLVLSSSPYSRLRLSAGERR